MAADSFISCPLVDLGVLVFLIVFIWDYWECL